MNETLALIDLMFNHLTEYRHLRRTKWSEISFGGIVKCMARVRNSEAKTVDIRHIEESAT